MKLLLSVLLSFVFLFANSDTNSTADKQIIFISYEKIPQKIFTKQIFTLKVKLIVANSEFNDIKDSVISSNGIKVLNLNENWKWYNDEVFYKTFYLKAEDSNATFPELSTSIYKNGKLISSQKFPKLSLNIINLNADKYFSNVIAEYLEIKKSKTTTFNDTSLITVLEIEAKKSNLKDFKLSWVIKDGVDSFQKTYPFDRIYYYAIIPKDLKEFKFTYFNTTKNRFVKKVVPIIIDDQKISTQSNINPKDNSLLIYKYIGYGFLSLLFIALYIKRKRVIYILFLIVLLFFFIMDITPFRNIKIAPNSKVYILPTKNSTVFYTTTKALEVQKLLTRDIYIKILLPNGKIGWIKDENVIEN